MIDLFDYLIYLTIRSLSGGWFVLFGVWSGFILLNSPFGVCFTEASVEYF
jgi:hypothetical protein